ncbi:WXG100 family type VII secretion target [Streptomyces sp. AK02-04a]|uniref:WXG100 family type VII secretion target n=1 Tax=Streptomyces sp. AK02-04a TaxID=3028649 RepID=UPI0029AB4D1D|nr:WXG100 family type VII secretion target [Streptomyces sp. AK02-04a]MDX3758882.1 WXG100 family type VII secretion target [Streptomyces sp. AK02-04a]
MSDSWVGGDIGGLRTMAETYKNAKKKLEDVVRPLSSAVEELVGDASWKGDAAEAFRATWSEDALTAGAFANLVHDAGDILDTLVGALSACETALQNAEHIAVKKGVPMGAQGAPLPFVTSDPPSADEQRTISAFGEYDKVRTEILHTAQHARLVAADKLRGLYAQVPAPVSPGDKITLADMLRGLYAYDAEDARAGGKEARTLIDGAKEEERAAKKELRAERKAYQKAGRSLPKDLPAKSAYRDAMTRVDSLEEDIARADHGSTKLPYDRALNIKLADAAEALRVGRSLEALPEFLKEVPVLDVAAAAACGLVEAKDDHDKGWSWQHSVVVDGGAALGGVAVGAGVGAALPIEGAVALAGVGVVAAVGATSLLDHSFHEHWSEDIHDHGVVGGVLTGTGHVFTETGDDGVRMAKDIWHGVKTIF